MPDLYSLLKISPHSTHAEVENAFLGLRKRLSSYAPGIEMDDESLRRDLPEMWEAWKTVLDDRLRGDYDKGIGLLRQAELLPATSNDNDRDTPGKTGFASQLKNLITGFG